MATYPATASRSSAASSSSRGVGIGSFTCVPGDLRREASSLQEFDEMWQAMGPGLPFDGMGCHSFAQLSGPVEDYVIECVGRALACGDVEPAAVDHIVFATMDCTLRFVDPDFVGRVLDGAGLERCLPLLLSHRQCCSSMTALDHACRLFEDPHVENVLVVAFDFISGDENRIRPFALFGDAVAACLVGSGKGSRFRLGGSSVGIDHVGLRGEDSFASRQGLATEMLTRACSEAGVSAEDVVRVFPCNLFQPLTVFNASALGIGADKLHFGETLADCGHCGNVDWMMNLVAYDESVGVNDGEAFLALSSAPGFFACAVLVATGGNGDD